MHTYICIDQYSILIIDKAESLQCIDWAGYEPININAKKRKRIHVYIHTHFNFLIRWKSRVSGIKVKW